jgi:hypothetical protein
MSSCLTTCCIFATGTKAAQQQVEETHSLMAANMLLSSRKHVPGHTWTREAIEGFFEKLNEKLPAKSPSRVGPHKLRCILNLVMNIPAPTLCVLNKTYHEYTWEGSWTLSP